MPRERRRLKLFRGREFSPIQREVLAATTRHLAFAAGRRVGKTEVSDAWLVSRIHARLNRLAAEVRAGRRRPWPGKGKPASVIRNLKPDILAWVVAPQDAHLDEHRGNLLGLYLTPGNEVFLHPAFREQGGMRKRDSQLWLWHEAGVCAQIVFFPASSERRMVSKGLDFLLVDEAGYIENHIFQTLKPATMDRRGEIFACGTPSPGDAHWFTRMCVSGLSEDHERFDAAIAARDPLTTTFLANTVEHAFLPAAREEALREIAFWGPLWSAKWIWADWRVKARNIYQDWVDGRHLCTFVQRRWWELNDRPLRGEAEPTTYGLVDWSGGTAPGAVVIARVWSRNPLRPDDPRPLVVVCQDYEGHDPYTDHGWWKRLHVLDQRWGVDKWLADPHEPDLINSACKAGLPLEPGAHQDKMGRISLVAGLLHWEAESGIEPALYVNEALCPNLPREFRGYRWRVGRDGAVQDKPKQHDDHSLDCLAMLVSEIAGGDGGVQAGEQRWR